MHLIKIAESKTKWKSFLKLQKSENPPEIVDPTYPVFTTVEGQ